jgi:DNA-directed RNA polymerase subunit RPC12/RpoP
MESTKTKGFRYKCLECQNENEMSSDVQPGAYIECDYCGVEYKVISIDDKDAGVCTIQIAEEEK